MRGASRHPITPNYTATNPNPPLHSLFFVRSLFNISSLLLSLSTCYSHTISSIPRSCNNVLSTLTTTSYPTRHTSFTYSLAGPKLKIRNHLVFYFWPTTAQTQIPGLLPRGPLLAAPSSTLYFYLFGVRGSCPLLPIFKASFLRTHVVGVLATGAWNFSNNFFLGPPQLHKVVGRPHKIKRHLVLAPALTFKIW